MIQLHRGTPHIAIFLPLLRVVGRLAVVGICAESVLADTDVVLRALVAVLVVARQLDASVIGEVEHHRQATGVIAFFADIVPHRNIVDDPVPFVVKQVGPGGDIIRDGYVEHSLRSKQAVVADTAFNEALKFIDRLVGDDIDHTGAGIAPEQGALGTL